MNAWDFNHCITNKSARYVDCRPVAQYFNEWTTKGIHWVTILKIHCLEIWWGKIVFLRRIFSSDVTIIESKSKIAILARNRIGSKSRIPCTTETILSIVAFANSFTLPLCDEIQSHQCSAGARTCLSSTREPVSAGWLLLGWSATVGEGHVRLITWQWPQSIGSVSLAMNRPIVDACCYEVNELCIVL